MRPVDHWPKRLERQGKSKNQEQKRGEQMDYEQADDGANCWDCGEPNDEANMNMCNECRHTICWDCQGGINSSYSSPHRDGRLADKLPCGNTTRILHL